MGKFVSLNIHFSTLLFFLIFPLSSFSQTKPFTAIIEKKIEHMTLEEKVGQLFMVGFPQKEISADLERFLSLYKPGSFLLFKRNIYSTEQLRSLNQSLYRASYRHTHLPPLIAIDQEGGSVSRLPITPAPPNALALGQTQSPLLAEEMGYQTGRFLREVGFNMNLAPVLDVADPRGSSFIGVRSFGSDPQLVGELGVAYSRGLLRAKVIPTAKHFPGTGNLKADPHVSVVQNTSSLEELKAKDLKPYEAYAQLGNHVAVMLSHLIYPHLDSSREPASFSRKIVTGLLRGDLNYHGLIVTDDLQMQGSKQLLRPEAAALRALQAGADIVMLTWSSSDQGRAFEYVKSAVLKGELNEDEVNSKLRRILSVKAFANLYRRDPKQPSLLQGLTLSSEDYRNLESNILEQNLKANLLVKESRPSSKPRTPASLQKVCLASPSKTFITSFVKNANKNTSTKLLTGTFDKEQLLSWISAQKCFVAVAAITGPKTAALLHSLPPAQRKQWVVVNLGAPRLISKKADYLRTIQLYFNHADSGKKIAQHLPEILAETAPSYVLLE